MHHLNIDLETFSSVNIKTGGLYRYVQAPDFQILLFGYSLDGAETVVIDLAQGEHIPMNIAS
ncbi:MAG: DNA polymerase, partial [Eubacteriales bacterium]